MVLGYAEDNQMDEKVVDIHSSINQHQVPVLGQQLLDDFVHIVDLLCVSEYFIWQRIGEATLWRYNTLLFFPMKHSSIYHDMLANLYSNFTLIVAEQVYNM